MTAAAWGHLAHVVIAVISLTGSFSDVLDHNISELGEDVVDEGLRQSVGDHVRRIGLDELGCAISHLVLQETEPN